jgi:hypothetical protein
MVGLQILDLPIGVRVPVSQPHLRPNPRQTAKKLKKPNKNGVLDSWNAPLRIRAYPGKVAPNGLKR